MVGVYQIKSHGNYIYKYLKRDNEVGEKLLKRLKNPKQLDIFKYLIENLYRNSLFGKHVVKGHCLTNRGDYMSPLIIGPCLADNQRLASLPNNTLVEILVAIGILTKSLTSYYFKKGYIIGDWTLHNIIFNLKTGQLLNIDLEGFYTYSPVGLDLSWNSGENKYSTIKKKLTRLQKRLITIIYQKSRDRNLNSQNSQNSQTSNLLTLVNIPDTYQLTLPFLITSNYPQIREYLHSLTISEESKPTKIYRVFINLKANKPYQLIISDDNKYQNNNSDYFYSFNLANNDDNFTISHLLRPLRSRIYPNPILL